MSHHLLCVRRRTVRAFLLAFLLALLGFVAQPTELVHAANAAEIASLTDLYNDLGGPGWTDNSNWLVGDPCTNNWYGVYCNAADNVIGINLSANDLAGNIDDVDMSGLINVWLLTLNDNQIGGSIEGFDLSTNTALVQVWLHDNQIGGSIEGFDLSTNTALGYLRLNDNQIGGNINGFDLSTHTALDRLHLNNNQMVGPLPSWMDGVTPPLIALDLSYNRCLEPSGIPAVDNFATTQDPNWQSSNTNCSTLQATAACYGTNLQVTVTDGDPSFDIAADDPGGTTHTDTLPATGSALLAPGPDGTWTNISVTEQSGIETLNLPNVTCGQVAPAGGGGSCPSCPVVSSGPASLTIDVFPPTDPANTSQGDGRGIFVLDDRPTWVIEVTNPNSAAVNDVVARAQIDKTVEITNITSTQGSTSADAENVVTMLLGTLEGGETATVTVETKVVPVGEICTSGWLDYQQGDDTECVDLYMLPGTLPATGGSPRRVANLWAEVLAGGVMLSAALGWVWIKKRRKA